MNNNIFTSLDLATLSRVTGGAGPEQLDPEMSKLVAQNIQKREGAVRAGNVVEYTHPPGRVSCDLSGAAPACTWTPLTAAQAQ